jgi:hypothetical protein
MQIAEVAERAAKQLEELPEDAGTVREALEEGLAQFERCSD